MGCQSTVVLGDNLTFSIATHDPDTGVLTDAQAAPAYRVYEDEGTTALLNGTMTEMVDAGGAGLTTGFYTGLIACTTGNGFEDGKSYTIYIEATVDSDKGGITFGFRAIADVSAEIATLTSLAAATRSANILDMLNTIIAVIESQRGGHTHQPSTGNILFIAPNTGGTHAGGARGGISDPYSTQQDAHDSAGTDYGHDLYILVADGAGATTTMSEDVTLSDGYALTRGPGRDLTRKPTANNTIAYAVTGDGCELSGFQIDDFNGTGSANGIQATDVDFTRLHNLWFNQTRGDGVGLLRCINTFIECCVFEGTGAAASGQGVHIVGTAGSSNNTTIHDCHFAETGGDSILIEDGTTDDTEIHHCTFHNSTGWGVNIGASSTNAQVHSNIFGNNASGDINDNGTTTIVANNEQWAKHSIATEARLAELDAANLPADVDLILADTNELQTDWADGGRLDLILDAILVDTGTTLPALIANLPTAIQNADAILLRDASNVEAAAGDHSLCYVILAMSEADTTTNAGKLTVFRTDGSTEFAQKTITSDSAADPLTGIE